MTAESTNSLLPTSVVITDDTMREGLQIESASIPVEAKLRLLDALGETGAKVISIGSFAHPKWTPQMACIDEIAERFVPKPGIRYTAAVFNKTGYDRADRFFPKINVRREGRLPATHVELCDTFARRNYNRSQAQQIAAMDATIAAAKAAGAQQASVGLGNPFGSNFEGGFSRAQRIAMLELMIGKWQAAGITVTRVSLLEAMGWNMPHLVRETMLEIRERWPAVTDFHLHLHNQRGATLTSYYEALQLGAREFDTCLGGMGGCLRQWPVRRPCADRRPGRPVPRDGHRDRLQAGQADRCGRGRRRGRRPPAVGPCLEVRRQAARRGAVPGRHAFRRDARRGRTLSQRTRGLPGPALALARRRRAGAALTPACIQP